MAGSTSPATLLHDVVITNEQTRAVWRAGRASIEHGLIVVPATPRHGPPAGMLDNTANTFTITANDGGDRGRRFANVTVDRNRSRPPKQWTFV
jgi:hypothetical protein